MTKKLNSIHSVPQGASLGERLGFNHQLRLQHLAYHFDQTENPFFTTEATEVRRGFNTKNRMKTNWSEATNSKIDGVMNVWHRGKQGCNFDPQTPIVITINKNRETFWRAEGRHLEVGVSRGFVSTQIFADYKSIVSHEVTKSQRILNSDKNRKNFDLDQNQSIEKNDLRKRVYESRLFQCFGLVHKPIFSVLNAFPPFTSVYSLARQSEAEVAAVKTAFNVFKLSAFSNKPLAFLFVFIRVHPWLKTALNAFNPCKSVLSRARNTTHRRCRRGVVKELPLNAFHSPFSILHFQLTSRSSLWSI